MNNSVSFIWRMNLEHFSDKRLKINSPRKDKTGLVKAPQSAGHGMSSEKGKLA